MSRRPGPTPQPVGEAATRQLGGATLARHLNGAPLARQADRAAPAKPLGHATPAGQPGQATPMRRHGRAVLAVVAAVALVAGLGGCASIAPAPAGWAPREAAGAELMLGDGSAAPAPADPTTPGDGTDGDTGAGPGAATPPTPAAVSAPGLDVRVLYNADPSSPVAARWGEIPGNQPFTELLRGRVTQAVAEHAATTGVPYTPAADAPGIAPESRGCLPGSSTRPAAELLADPAVSPTAAAAASGAPTLTIVCEVLAASGSVLVEALRIVTSTAGQVTADSTTVYYADTGGAYIASSDSFLTDDGLRTLLPQLVQSLKVAAGALQPAMVQSVDEFTPEQLRALFARLSFTADGSLRIHVPDDFSTPELEALAGYAAARPNPLVVTVPAATAATLLSEQARQIQQVLASGAPLALPPAPYRGQESVDCTLFACVAVTFDDGPGAYTPEVLDALDARRAAATFYVQGYRTEQRPGDLVRMRDTGHQIGNHTYNHPDLRTLTDDEIKDQLGRASQAVQNAAGLRPSTFRPPYGAVDERVLAQTELPAILWSVDTNDWQLPDDATLLDRAVAQPRPGGIVLLHDVHENTARMTPAILDGLLGRGFTLVTVQQLLGGTPPPHTTTTRR